MPETLVYRAYWLLWHSLDWFYPPFCAGCGKAGRLWCDDCIGEASLLVNNFCPKCGSQQHSNLICTDCSQTVIYYEMLRSWAVFGGKLRKAIHQLKYRRNIALGQALAEPMIQQLLKLNWSVDLVAPVPLGSARLAERGYNQASLLARPIALYFRIKYRPNIIKRCRETLSQVGLTLDSRRENVSGAFVADSSQVQGKKVLVIDDVITSGSTMNACAEALVKAGAKVVYGYSLARAGYDSIREQQNKGLSTNSKI